MNFFSIHAALSPARMSTYLHAVKQKPPSLPDAMALYAWNSHVGGLLLSQLSVCEVVVRNAAAEALSAAYGPQWPWNPGFMFSLKPEGQNQLTKARLNQTTTGKVIAELPFGFWEHLFVAAFDPVLWTPLITSVFQNLPPTFAPFQARGDVRTRLANLRLLRNRIAHHEPLMNQPVSARLSDIQLLVGYRCSHTAAWLASEYDVPTVFNNPSA
jgi:hypothetical protein